jgi:membrane protein required for colicin V production
VIFDLLCAGLVALLAIWGLWRGMIRQIFGILGFVAGIVLAHACAEPLGASFARDLGLPLAVTTACAALAIFVAAEITAKIAGSLLAHLFKGGFTGAVDRLGGFLLGFVKGILVAWAFASIVSILRPQLRPIEERTQLARLDLSHSRAVAAATSTNLISELRRPPGHAAR